MAWIEHAGSGRSLHLAGCCSVMHAHAFSSQVSLEQLAAFLAPAAHCTLTISCGHGMHPSQTPCGVLDQKGTATINTYTKSTCIIAESNHCLVRTKIGHNVLLDRAREKIVGSGLQVQGTFWDIGDTVAVSVDPKVEVPAHLAGKIQTLNVTADPFFFVSSSEPSSELIAPILRRQKHPLFSFREG